MATRGVQITLTYMAYNVSTGAYVTGDAANHTLGWTKDGTAAVATNPATEVKISGTGWGQYSCTMTATEASCGFGTLSGTSSTGSVILIPCPVGFVYLPNAASGGSGGVATADSSNQVKANLTAVNTHAVTDTTSGLPDVNSENIGGAASAGAAGKVALDLTQAVPTSNTADTIGDALNAARAQGFGKWVISGTTLSLYAADGTTVVRSFTLDSATSPTQRV